jgi:hypothetical protein
MYMVCLATLRASIERVRNNLLKIMS